MPCCETFTAVSKCKHDSGAGTKRFRAHRHEACLLHQAIAFDKIANLRQAFE